MSKPKSQAAAPADAVAPAVRRVRLDLAARPGLQACGAYLPGRVYSVPADEAERLIRDKGFTEVQE